ncbi:MAG: hypothetical protein R3E34_07685 [Rhodocyclaceae bacterium]
MGRIIYVAMFFVMAIACFVIAISDSSWGWALGGIVFVLVGIFATRQLKVENEIGRQPASNRFIIFAFLALFLGFAAIFLIMPPV